MKKVLIFGGTQGLGKELADIWRGRGESVTALGREQCDLQDASELENYLSTLDVQFDRVVYCAGKSAAGHMSDLPSNAIEECFRVNLFSPIALFNHFKNEDKLPAEFVFILSGASEFLVPGLSAYSLSKRALRDFVHYIRLENSTLPCKVLAFYPGGMHTGFDAKTRVYGEYVLPNNFKKRDPKAVALKLVRLIDRGREGVWGLSWPLRILRVAEAMLPTLTRRIAQSWF